MDFTRNIEDNNYLRENLDNFSVISKDGSRLLLKVNSIATPFERKTSDMETLLNNKRAEGEYSKDCIICIDFLERDTIRIRLNKGTEVLENKTLMVDKDLKPATDCHFREDNERVLVTTGNLCITIALNPYSVSITNKMTGKTTKIGGPEKNCFNARDTLPLGFCYVDEKGTAVTTENFELSSHEAIYGFGEKFIKLNKVGQTIELYADDGVGIGTTRTYKNIPFYVSTNGYGVYFNHTAPMTFWVGSKYAGDVQVGVCDDFVDYYVFTGDIKTIIDTYTDLTGKSPMPPKWSFGYWQSKISYESAEEGLEIVKSLRKADFPCDVIHFDTNWFEENWKCDWEFSKERFPDPEGWMKELLDLGVKVSVWQLPYVRGGTRAFDEIASVDGFVKNKDGEIYDIRTLDIMARRPEVIGIIDFTNPKAVLVYQELLRRLYKLGVRVIKTDFGEAAPEDGVYYDGTSGKDMHNLYPLLYNKVAFEVTKEFFGEGIVWGRAAYAGNQRYPLYWGGDNSPNLNNIVPQLAGGLSLGFSGFTFWSQDVGGFMGDTNDNLLIRWMQFSILMSHIRIHGEGTRELYKFSDKCQDICRKYLKLRYRMLPYIWGTSEACCRSGLPVTRALVIDYQDDPNVWNIEDQYMSGDSFMVAPIYTEDNKRMVYFPKGVWTDWNTGEKITGGCWKEIYADLDTLPLYVKEGAIIPLCPEMNYVGEKEIDEIELRIFPFERDVESKFSIVTDKESIDVIYKRENGKDAVLFGDTDIKINVAYI